MTQPSPPGSAVVLAIVGGSGAGKSTLASLVVEALGAAQVALVAEDAYYRSAADLPSGPLGAPNWDCPQAKELDLLAEHLARLKGGESIRRPDYDFAAHRRCGFVTVDARPFIVVEGLHGLTAPAIRAHVDHAVFLCVGADRRLARRLARDVSERGRTAQSVREQFASIVEPMASLHVEPQRAFASEVLALDDDLAAAARHAARLATLMRARYGGLRPPDPEFHMPLSLHAAGVQTFIARLAALDAMLEKLTAHCEAKKTEPEAFLTARLFPDMFTLSGQIQIACDFANRAGARLAGLEPTAYPDDEKTIADLKARIGQVLAFLRSLDPAQIEAGGEREITFRTGPDATTTMPGAQYLTGFVLPNFYFHVAMAYALMRHNGLEIGKRDFFGPH